MILAEVQPCLSAGIVELWAFASQFQDALELQSVPSIAEMEQAFVNPDQPKSTTTAALVSAAIIQSSYESSRATPLAETDVPCQYCISRPARQHLSLTS